MDKKSMVVVALSFVVMLFILLSMGDRPVVNDIGTIDESPVVESGATVSEPVPSMKIDVRVACESALAYTTFPDGASAEAFIGECIEGKHPEVIERYINDMGVDGAVI